MGELDERRTGQTKMAITCFMSWLVASMVLVVRVSLYTHLPKAKIPSKVSKPDRSEPIS